MEQPIVTSQTVDIRVSHRQNGRETWGWYSAASSGPVDAPSLFDGRHLRIRSIRKNPAVDLTFQPEAQRWTGTWTREGQPQQVVLERPRPPMNVAPDPWRGSWEGVPDASGKAQTRLHIDQSSDGTLTVWIDRFLALIDQRHGELLAVVSLGGDTITLSTTNPGGRRYTFLGRLSPDGLRLSGSWGKDGGGGTLNASESFRRLP
jgi:hypothetical protein